MSLFSFAFYFLFSASFSTAMRRECGHSSVTIAREVTSTSVQVSLRVEFSGYETELFIFMQVTPCCGI
jgi:hypothetical protein